MNRRFPFTSQLESVDCGPACLKTVAAFYGKQVPLEHLRNMCRRDKHGVSMAGIHDAAETIGLKAATVLLSWEQLKQDVRFPCIAHWKDNHFVVIYDVRKRGRGFRITVADPSIGVLDYIESDFRHCWCKEDGGRGVVMLLEPAPDFTKKEPCHSGSIRRFPHNFKYLLPYSYRLTGLFFSLILIALINMVFPIIMQGMVDRGIGNKNVHVVELFLLGQFALVAGLSSCQLIRAFLSKKVSFHTDIDITTAFINKLIHLPPAFFMRRRVGDIFQRLTDCSRLGNFLTVTLINMSFALLSLLVYSVVMAKYNLLVLAVFFIGSIVYLGWGFLFLERRKKIDYMRFQVSSELQNNLVDITAGIKEIKNHCCGNRFLKRYSACQYRSMDIGMKGLQLAQCQQIGATFIDQAKNLLITYIAAKSVINGSMSIGMMMSLQFILGQLNAPVLQTLFFMQETQDAVMSHSRIEDVYQIQDEEPAGNNLLETIPMVASITMQNVCFSYDGSRDGQLKDISLTIPFGKVTAIVGASGSGKTTLFNLMTGAYSPSSGELLLGGVPLKSCSLSAWRAHFGSVMQDGFLFNDTIAANIALAEDAPDDERLKKAASISRILDWIESLPKGFGTEIGSDVGGLSAGQKQRILIARAVYKNADYYFLDEATNSLDAYNESLIMHNMNSFFNGKTVVIAAHRLSTVKSADCIIVLDKGCVVESGTHESLMALGGYYYRLVKNQT